MIQPVVEEVLKLCLKEKVRVDKVKNDKRCSRQMYQKKSKLVGVVQQYGEGWKEQAQREGKNYKPRAK